METFPSVTGWRTRTILSVRELTHEAKSWSQYRVIYLNQQVHVYNMYTDTQITQVPYRSCKSKIWLCSCFINSVYVWVPMHITHSIKYQVSRSGLCAHSATTSLLMNDIQYWEGYFNTTVNFPYAAKQYNIHNNSMNNTINTTAKLPFTVVVTIWTICS